MGNDSGQVIAEKIFGFFATKMPKLPHSEPLTAELSGAVDSGAHAVDRRIGKTLSAYFLTEQAAFFILITLVKNTAAAIFGRTEDTVTDKKLISSLQGLRAVAFLSVILSHCGAPWLGPWAISVFVALSGFLMTCNYYDRPRTAPGLRSAIAFSLKKIRKLYPLHLIMMAAALLFVLKGLLAQPSARGVLSCAAQLVVSIFLLQTWIPSSRFWFCLNGVAWYLSVQAFLYAIFPPLLAVLKKADVRRLRCIAAVIFCAQCLASFVFWKAGLSGKAAFYLTYLCPVFRAGDFTISCCMGCLYHSRKQESGLPGGAFSLLELAAVLLASGCLFIAARQVGVLGAVAFRYNVLFTPSAVLLVWLLAVGKGIISRLLSAKPFLWLAGLSPYGFLIHQVLIRYMEWTADKFSFTVHPVVWTLTVYLLTLCLSSFYKALERRVRQRHTQTGA